MALRAYLKFHYKNYLREHRYVREIVAVVIFNIFFYGFLYDRQPEDAIWTVFGVFALLLNLVSVPSLFFFEKGNTLYFLLIKPYGRRNYFCSKIIFIILVDLFWVGLFTLLYGLRFLNANYFLLLPLRWLILLALLSLSTLLISFSFTYRASISWLILLVLILGSVVNKAEVFPVQGTGELYKFLTFLLPPFLELIFLNVSLLFTKWQIVFLAVALAQTAVLSLLSYRLILKKDFL